MSRILVPLPYDVSDLAHGRNLRVVNLLNALCETDTVTCLSADASRVESARRVLPHAEHAGTEEPNDHVASCHEPLASGVLRHRALRFFSHHPQLERAASELACDHDVALGFDLPALSSVLAAGKASPALKTALDVIDDPWLTWSSQSFAQRWSVKGAKSAAALRIIRRKILETLHVLTAVAPRDAETLARASGRSVEIIPNGIHMPEGRSSEGREPLIVFTGAMQFPPNEAAAIHFIKNIWPRIQQAGESPRCALVGSGPSPRLYRLAEWARIQVTGYVDDLGAWLRRARVAVAPMVSGSGMKNKILEACAAGCPVVTTPLGAEGLPIGEAYGILCAETPEAFAATVVELIRQPARCDMLGRAAAAMVSSKFTWRESARRLHSLWARDFQPSERSSHKYNTIRHEDSSHSSPDTKETLIHAVS